MDDSFSSQASVDGVRPGQHLLQAFFGGLIAAVAGSFLWMYVPAAINVDIGYVSLGMGILVGMMVRFAGNGSNFVFGLVGMVMTFAGCALAEILATIELSTDVHNDFLAIFKHLDLPQLTSNLIFNATPLIYVLHVLGLAVSYFLSIRK